MSFNIARMLTAVTLGCALVDSATAGEVKIHSSKPTLVTLNKITNAGVWYDAATDYLVTSDDDGIQYVLYFDRTPGDGGLSYDAGYLAEQCANKLFYAFSYNATHSGESSYVTINATPFYESTGIFKGALVWDVSSCSKYTPYPDR